MLGWLRRRRRKRIRAAPVPETWAAILAENAPFVARLSDDDRARLHGHIQVFLAEKHFIPAGGMEITEEVKVTIAAAAARVVLHLDIGRYDRLTEIVVYPGAYKHPDAADGVATLGEAHTWGTVVLAWDAVLDGMRHPRDGHDTAVHEFAHVLDGASGSFDGAPSLHAGEHYRPWAAAMQRNFDRLRRGDRALRRVLRDYGATNEAEFFAVATEAYFERPDELAARAPALFAELDRFYHPPRRGKPRRPAP